MAIHQDQTLFDGTAYTVCAEHSNGMQSKNPLAGCVYKADMTRTLDANGGNPNCAQGGMLICNEAYSIGNGQVNSLQMAEKAGALNCMDDTEKVLIGDEHSAVFGMETYSDYQDAKIASTLRAEGGPLAGGSENFAVQDTKTYAIGNGQPDGLSLSEKAGSLNCMHDQQAVMIEKEVVGALLSRDYKGVSKWAAEEGKLIVQ